MLLLAQQDSRGRSYRVHAKPFEDVRNQIGHCRTRATLFDGTFVGPDENVVVRVLESDVFSNANFSINVMIGYEAVNATGTYAYAVLPFNIQPAS